MAFQSQLRLFVLKYGYVEDTSLYRLEKGWTLHFSLDASLAGLKVRLFVNHPVDPKEGPHRTKYRELEWVNEADIKADNFDSYAPVPIIMAGSFNYFFTIDGSDLQSNANGRGYFLVDPVLRVGRMDDKMALETICCQSVQPKLLGTFSDWPNRLRVSKESGYNMLHFMPIQTLGQSDSNYCIKDQLNVDPRYFTKNKQYTYEDIKKLVEEMKDEWEILSIVDIVINHTATDSPWLLEHPECSYNLVNSAHLKPAYLLDRALWNFSLQVNRGTYENKGLPALVDSEHHLSVIRSILGEEIIPKLRLWEFVQCDVENLINQFKTAISSGVNGDDIENGDLLLINDPQSKRFGCTIDVPKAIHYYFTKELSDGKCSDFVERACEHLRAKLHELNNNASQAIHNHINIGLDNFIANARWRFVDGNGEKLGKVSPDTPLMWNYFRMPEGGDEGKEEAIMNSQEPYCMAHNGWIMGSSSLDNFAEPGSHVYLRRELVPWGDVVKLRYGESPRDCPFLWSYMREYTREMARVFHGIRIDNCHSTPIHVAEFMLDEGRKVRSDLYIIAELFTNSEQMDNIFINRLGINSLIREGLNGHNPRELGRLVHRYGGMPVGSFVQPPIRLITPSVAHAIFYDQTHDNESVIVKHTVEDILGFSAIISMTYCASASTRGYDELLPHRINVVNEKRLYKMWKTKGENNTQLPSDPSLITLDTGLIKAKKVLNEIHVKLAKAGFKEVFVDMISDDIMTITRHNPVSHQSVVLFTHTCFSANHKSPHYGKVCIPGVVDQVLFEGCINKVRDSEFNKHEYFLNGLENYEVELRTDIKATESSIFSLEKSSDVNGTILNLHNFKPGSAVIFKVLLPHHSREQVLKLRGTLSTFGYQMKTLSSRRVLVDTNELEKIFEKMSLGDLNRVLYRTDEEEKSDGLGFGTYHIPDHGNLPYCGLQGFVGLLDQIRPHNDLGHSLCENLRKGNWMLDYICNRLMLHSSTSALGHWLETAFYPLKNLPRHLIPSYFDAIMSGVYSIALEFCWKQMSTFAGETSKFVRELCLGSVQMCSYVASSKLNLLSPNIKEPRPTMILNNGKMEEASLTLSAGFPHFSSGLFRNWGRDTFVALRGLLLLTNRFNEARHLILAYGGCLRHGLIPNLLGEGIKARYNSRDAVWFWLQAIKDFCLTSPDGISLLQDTVLRLYPKDDDSASHHVEQKLYEVVQEALQRHASGVEFREREAGEAIDWHMKSEGFNIKLGVDWNTGFVFGGNIWNCGTWMDKMGSSTKAANKGYPATPRDGSAIEVVALCASVVSWLQECHLCNQYPYGGVQDQNGITITWKEWFEKIKNNFDKFFWIGTSFKKDSEDCGSFDADDTGLDKFHNEQFINRVNIYKDSVNSGHGYTDYQLRCNFCIGIAICPEIFSEERAWKALWKAQKHLMGPLGIKTLDPSDLNYVGDYHNDDDSDDFKRASGFNYHQGPEWVWPVGYFLRAKLMIARKLHEKYQHASLQDHTVEMKELKSVFEDTMYYVEKTLTAHNVYLQASTWKSLPELTNSGGQVCKDSCEAQAWSVSSIIEVLHLMKEIKKMP